MQLYFSKIRFAGEDSILVTGNEGKPLIILNHIDIEKLNKEWRSK